MARKIGSRYTANQILGRGSAGTVWLGEGPDGPVAVKLLREDLASDQELVGRFVQERTALLGLDHPHVVARAGPRRRRQRPRARHGSRPRHGSADPARPGAAARPRGRRRDRGRRRGRAGGGARRGGRAPGREAGERAARHAGPARARRLAPRAAHRLRRGQAHRLARGGPGRRRSSARRTISRPRSSRGCRRGPPSTSTPWRPSCTSSSPGSRPSAAGTPGRCCGGT